MTAIRIKRALISVSDKSNLDLLVPHLKDWEVEVIASGGTQKHLESLGLTVTPIESVTNNPEAFSGRMKTLSFQVASGLLYRRESAADVAQAKDLNIYPIDLLICNLYPFEKHLSNDASFEELIEQIDIGGPTLIRAAAKNFRSVCVCTDPGEYQSLINEFHSQGETSHDFRLTQAKAAFAHTAKYESVIANYFNDTPLALPPFQNQHELRYGENPQQSGSILTKEKQLPNMLSPIQGKALSYNNVLDLEAAIKCCFTVNSVSKKPTSIIIKHNNPCGAAAFDESLESLQQAWSSDSVSAFGSVIACSYTFDIKAAKFLSDKFVEVIAAPDFTEEALSLLQSKKNLRLVKFNLNRQELFSDYQYKSVFNSLLVQSQDKLQEEFQNVTERQFNSKQKDLIHFGIALTQYFKSNAISLVQLENNGFKLIGAGMGNPNRLVSIQQAVEKAKENGYRDLSKAILISDAFFPFSDNIELAHQAGIQSFVQPGGSIKDEDIIRKCDELEATMVFTGRRHFLH